MTSDIFEKQILFFGIEGQNILQNLKIAVVGVGGLGSHLVQQLAFLGVKSITIIDDDYLEMSNKNRLIGVFYGDKEEISKIDIAERLILSINPNISVIKILNTINSYAGLEAIKNSDLIFGSVDNDGARLFLNESCLAYEIPFIDLASDILPDNSEYGGRIISVIDNSYNCLYCLDEISPDEARKDLENPGMRKDREDIYGIPKDRLLNNGPAVVSFNGMISSIAITEFIVDVTKIRRANNQLIYYGSSGKVFTSNPEPNKDCYYCNVIRGNGDNVDLKQYFKK